VSTYSLSVNTLYKVKFMAWDSKRFGFYQRGVGVEVYLGQRVSWRLLLLVYLKTFSCCVYYVTLSGSMVVDVLRNRCGNAS
jgi:hypothetical protein